MVYKLIESEYGEYIAPDGMLYDLLEATNVMTPQGKNVGWTEYKNLDAAIEGFNLVHIEAEEDLTEYIIATILSDEVNK